MAQSLEQYVAQANQAYQPAQTAIQSQLNALSGNLATGEEKINRNYAQQQSQLESQRNQAAEASSLAAAASGGAFGGQGNIARRKYYEQTFVPAQTQLQTNQANDLDTLRQNIENQRTSLNSQLANLQAQANQQALQQYWAEVEAEKQREAQLRAQREAAAAQNAQNQYLMEAIKNQGSQQGMNKGNVDFLTWVKNYSGYNDKTKNAIIGLAKTANMKSANYFGGNAAKSIANSLQNSNYYKQYQNWRNS